MPRKKKEPQELVRREPAPATGTMFVENASARVLAAIGPEDAVWNGGVLPVVAGMPGALVKIQPPPTATPDEIERLEAELRKTAQAVRTMPAGPGQQTPVQQSKDPEAARAGAREVVMAMVEEVPTQDRAMLREVCSAMLTEV